MAVLNLLQEIAYSIPLGLLTLLFCTLYPYKQTTDFNLTLATNSRPAALQRGDQSTSRMLGKH